MKKFLLTLALTGMCAFGLTACQKEEFPASQEELDTYADSIMADINDIVSQGNVEETVAQLETYFGAGSGDTLLNACESFESALEETGNYNSVVDGTIEAEGDLDNFTMTFEIDCEDRNAIVTVDASEAGFYPEVTVSPKYSMGELMSKAGMNTLMGMGTVFAVLILIMILIYVLGWIAPKIEKLAANISASSEKRAEKKAAKKAARDTDAAVDNTIAQIIKNEEVSDDTELVAVIAAAIAAYEGTSADGVVIRSIRRASTNKWQRA